MGTFRFSLALAVVVSHFDGLWGHRYMDGSMAVRCFFIVSGFLIAMILSGKYDTRDWAGLKLFYSNRALRIFVPYWSFLLLTVMASWLISAWLGQPLLPSWHETSFATRAYLLFTNIFVFGQEWAMWLSYDHGSISPSWGSYGEHPHLIDFHLIQQSWSISLELMFYAMAPFLVRRHWALLIFYMGFALVLRRVVSSHDLSQMGFNFRFFPVELIFFVGGILSYRAYVFAISRGLMSAQASIAVTAALLSMLFVMRYWTFWEGQPFYILVAVALPFLFEMSRRYAFDGWLGELSYPIYLCHLAVLSIGTSVAQRLFGPTDQDWLSLFMIAVTVAIAIVYIHLIDAPFERWRQQRVMRRRQFVAATV